MYVYLNRGILFDLVLVLLYVLKSSDSLGQ